MSKKFIAASAAGLALAASSALPALAAGESQGAGVGSPIGQIFSGILEEAAPDGLLVGKERRKGASELIAVDTDKNTVVSRGGELMALATIAAGSQVIVSGTKNKDGSVLASKIIVRT